MKTKSLQIVALLFIAAGIFNFPFYNYSSAQTIYYGLTTQGGTSNDGTIFTFDPSTSKDSVVWNFGGYPNDGQDAEGSLVYDSTNGLFYGLTAVGGLYRKGTLISFNPVNDSEKLIWSFSGQPDGENPSKDLVYDAANGLFYGTTFYGGTNGPLGGTIFSFNPRTGVVTIVWNFGTGTDGQNPEGNLTLDPNNGLYYGMTNGGGSLSDGIIFSFDLATNKEKVLYNFTGYPTDGDHPQGDLTFDVAKGLFYGFTTRGGNGGNSNPGTIISFDPTTNTEKVLWMLGNGNDGSIPYGDLIYDASNSLFYGTTLGGGIGIAGVILSFNPADDSEKVVWDFKAGKNDGGGSNGDLIYDPDNGLYYVTTNGGGNGNPYPAGTIVSFNTTTDSEKVVWSFGNATDGKYPSGNLAPYPKLVAPVAAFGTDTSGCAGVPLQFQSLSSHATSYKWSFAGGNPATSTLPNPAVIYNSPGIYDVQLIAGNGNLFDTLLVKSYIHINPSPTAGTVSALKDSLCPNTIANLSVAGGSGTIQWQMADSSGSFSNISGATATSISNLFVQTKRFRVITTLGSCSDTSIAKTIFIIQPPTAAFSYSDSGVAVMFTSNSNTASNYLWHFGDSSATSTAANPVHHYDSLGTYHVCLTTSNKTNCNYTLCQYITLYPAGINNINSNGTWQIYPNPFGNQFVINSSEHNIIENITVCDVLGRTVLYRYYGNNCEVPLKLDASLLQSGMYFLRIQSGDFVYRQNIMKE